MKKLLSLALALMMVMSLATVAFATENSEAGQTVSFNLKKVYTINKSTNSDYVVPDEQVLNFNVTASEGAPAMKVNALTVDTPDNATGIVELKVTGTVEIPANPTRGVYEYTVKEALPEGATVAAGEALDVTTELKMYVVITNKVDQTGEILPGYSVEVGAEKGTGGTKADTFNNTYGLGELAVKKTVSGNLGSKTQDFTIHVNLTSDYKVLTPIKLIDSDKDSAIKTAWNQNAEGKYVAEVTLKLAHDETVTLANLPAGVSYTVTEDNGHILQESEAMDPNNPATGYDVEYVTNDDGVIAAGLCDSVEVQNSKSTDINTGVTLDSAPFILILAVCAGAVVLFVVKKRRSVEF